MPTFDLINLNIIPANSRGDAKMPPCEMSDGDTITIAYWNHRENRGGVEDTFRELRKWLNENGLKVYRPQYDSYEADGIYGRLPYIVTVRTGEDFNYLDPDTILGQPDCHSCGNEVEYPHFVCPECGVELYCPSCHRIGNELHYDEEFDRTFCEGCGKECNDCGGMYDPRSWPDCPICRPMMRCTSCGDTYLENEMYTNENTVLCESCHTNYCNSCGTYVGDDDFIPTDENGNPTCTACLGKKHFETFDEKGEKTATQMKIPVIPGRENIRLCGIEIEGAAGPNTPPGYKAGTLLARELYSAELCHYPEMGNYHGNEHDAGFAFVERDRSVDWELVIGPINVANVTHMTKLNKTVKIVRNMIRDERLKLDMRAGMHVHVEAANVSLPSTYNLHRLYMYTEDFLYRLGAAKWAYHRAIPLQGKGAAAKTPMTLGKINFARAFGNNRYYGLSFENYFKRYFSECECGARTYGMFEECTCDLGKCTFEFRLFNTTANSIKIHAYLAICQALVAKAVEMDEIKDDEYSALDFIPKKVEDMTLTERNKLSLGWQERLNFVANELPLTKEEKESIFYCVVNSEMKDFVEAEILLEREEN